MSEVTADKLVAAYMKIQTARQRLAKEYETEDAVLKSQMKLITDKLADICKEVGVSSFSTPYGVVNRKVKTWYYPSDWERMYDFIKEHDAFYLLEKRVCQSHMARYLEDHPDQLPIGLNSRSEYVVSVTKKR